MQIEFPRPLQARFEQAILSGELPRGQRVDCDELAARLSASRDAMMKVLAASYRKGLIQPTACGFEILGLSQPTLDSVFQHTAKAGFKPTSIVRATTTEPATEQVAQKLDLPPGAPVYRQERTRLVNGEVLANQVNYIPYEVAPGLDEKDLSNFSFQQLLEGHYHAVFSEFKESTFLAPCAEDDLRILGLPPGSQMLVIERIGLSVTRRPLVWANIHIRPDRYDYVAGLWPQAAALLKPRAD